MENAISSLMPPTARPASRISRTQAKKSTSVPQTPSTAGSASATPIHAVSAMTIVVATKIPVDEKGSNRLLDRADPPRLDPELLLQVRAALERESPAGVRESTPRAFGSAS